MAFVLLETGGLKVFSFRYHLLKNTVAFCREPLNEVDNMQITLAKMQNLVLYFI